VGHGASSRLAATAVGAALALALAACGAASASHVVPPSSPTTQPVVPAQGTTPTPAGTQSTALSSQTLDDVEAELGALDGTLTQADNDLANPQGDS